MIEFILGIMAGGLLLSLVLILALCGAAKRGDGIAGRKDDE